MKNFLGLVASDLIQKVGENLARTMVVFPNKRASLFFNKALTELSDKPIWSPQYTTISELFRSSSASEIADHIKLVCELHTAYKEVTGSDEPLDQFYSWGELMLADFDDIDKHCADASKVFSLLSDIHELDGVEYLTDKQKEVLQRFFSNFSSEHNSILKQRFLTLWNKFHDIYVAYRKRLADQGIAYEGMLYREVAEKLRSDNPQVELTADHYVFIGFNLLNDVEQAFFSYIKNEGKALFYWDYDDYYMHGAEAGRFISQYLKYFPNELTSESGAFHNFESKKDIAFISAQTEDIQARYIAQWLTPERIAAGRRTAIVMADEKLLETVIHCLPDTVSHVNITTGYPLEKAPVSSLIRLVTAMYRHKSYTLHTVNAVLRHPYVKYLSPEANNLHDQINKDVLYYPSPADLSADDNLATLFTPIKEGKGFCNSLADRLIWITKTIALNAPKDDFMTESLFRMYTLLNRLKQTLEEQNITDESASFYTRLLQQVIQTTTIPFHGEPIEGIQIMGVLETRNLDFEHLLVLSCNEGNLPAKVNDSSFIPHSVRKAYNLTTVENKVAIYAYYFHRMLQRCNDISITYNNSTGDGKTGEMSRFMLQLTAESKLDIRHFSINVSQEASMEYEIPPVQKTQEMVQKLIDKGSFSPSALGKYLRCPLSFYYMYIEDINKDDENDEEEMDGRSFGNIFHKAAELLYKDFEGRQVTASYIKGLLDEKGHITIQRKVDEAFRTELFKIKDPYRPTPRMGGLYLINREMVINFIKSMLRYDLRHAPVSIIGLEKKVYDDITVSCEGKDIPLRIGGYIDRLDCVTDGDGIRSVRIIDYKTGRYDTVSLSAVEDIFNPENVSKHADYYMQALIYSSIIDNAMSGKVNGLDMTGYSSYPISTALLFLQRAHHEDYSPILSIDGKPITNASELLPEFRDNIKQLIERILDKRIPFSPTNDKHQCTNCIYAQLCH